MSLRRSTSGVYAVLEGQTPRFVSAAEITRNFGMWQDRAGQGPLVVTHHGRPRCVLVSAESYRAMTEGGARMPAADGDASRDAIEHALIVERLGAGLIELDGELGIVRANAMSALLLGRPVEALVGHALADAAPTLATGLAASRLRRAVRDGEEARFDWPMADGAIAVHVFPWPGGAAMLLRRIPVGEEESALARAGALDEAMAAHGGISAARLTVRGTIAAADRAFAALSGFTAPRLAGVRLVDLMALGARSGVADAIERALSGLGASAIDSRLLVNGGDERAVRIALAPVADGMAVGGVSVVMTAV